MTDQFLRLERLIGKENVELLHSKSVAICGIGAVGGHALETLARCGIGHIKAVDFDTIEESNINRQILALHSTVGMKKTDAALIRVRDIYPDCDIKAYPIYISEENHDEIFAGSDIVLDCIDSLSAKVSLLEDAYKRGVPIVSSMGAALRRTSSLVRTADIFDTYGCPLARQVRSMLKKRGVGRGIEAVFSPEKVRFDYIDPDQDDKAETDAESKRKRRILGSLPTVTAVFGITIAELALRKLLPQDALYGEPTR